MERTYVIPLRGVKTAPKNRRSKLAIKAIKSFIGKHMKSKKVKLEGPLNERVWSKSIENIPSKIKVKASTAEDGSVMVALAE